MVLLNLGQVSGVRRIYVFYIAINYKYCIFVAVNERTGMLSLFKEAEV